MTKKELTNNKLSEFIISCHWSLSISPGNIRKHWFSDILRGFKTDQWHETR